MNLETENLIPLKTKGRLSTGELVVFVGNDHQGDYHYNFVVKQAEEETLHVVGEFVCLDYQGRSSSGEILEALIPRWQPQPGDEVQIVYGLIANVNESSYQRAASGPRLATIVRQVPINNPADPGFYYVTLGVGPSVAFEVHRNQLRLIRRP